MGVSLSSLSIISSKKRGLNPLPIFRAIEQDLPVAVQGTLDKQDYINIGKNAAFCVLPYRMQDRYTRATERADIKTIVLENTCLRATFLPDYGARLWSLYHKREQRELLFCNPVLQLGNLAVRNAWFSGGIEWNVSQFGHTFGTCSAMFAAVCRDAADNEFLRFYQFERCREIFWQLDFHLPPGSETLHLYAKIINDTSRTLPMYWWTNIAVPETKGARVFSEDARVLYIVPEKDKCFGQAELPSIDSLLGKDASYPSNFFHSSEYFFQNDSLSGANSAPWEAVSYENGQIFFERSSSRLRYRKMFCWGRHAGGQRWKDFLSLSGQGDYLEIQAGMAPTQLHGLEIPAHTEWDFVQVFGGCKGSEIFDEEWRQSCRKVKAIVEQYIPQRKILEWLDMYRQLGRQESGKLLHLADAWGALELRRREIANQRFMIKSIVLPIETLGPEQQDWLHLLEDGVLPQPSAAQVGGTQETISWMVSLSWLELVEKSLNREGGDHWYSRLHLGVMYYEQGRRIEAVEQWQRSLQQQENPLAYRNLAYCEWQEGNLEKALTWYEKIFQIELNNLDSAYAEEYMETLLQLQRYNGVWDFYQQYQREYYSIKMAVLAGRAAVELEQMDYVEKLLQMDYPQLKEGENWLADIWYIAKAKEIAKRQGVKDDSALRQRVRSEYAPPEAIDFRMK